VILLSNRRAATGDNKALAAGRDLGRSPSCSSLEYLVRLWAAPEVHAFSTSSRRPWPALRWGDVPVPRTDRACSPSCRQPCWGGRPTAITGSDTASVFCILWVLKLGPACARLRQRSPGSCPNERAPIAQRADPVRHRADARGQPQPTCLSALRPARGTFRQLCRGAMWWAVVTLTTNGPTAMSCPLTVRRQK